MKRLFPLVLAALVGCAPMDKHTNYAIQGQSADAITTAIGMSTPGLTEANPLGAGIFLAKPLVISYVNQLPEPDRTNTLNLLGDAGWGLAVNNAALILFNTPLAPIAGIATFIWLRNTHDE